MANVSLGRAVLVLATETGSFISDLDNADAHTKKLEQAVDNVGKGFKGLGKDTTDLGEALTKGLTLPITAVVGSLAALAIQAAGTGDEIAKQAREAGLGAQSWQELSFALGQVARVSDEELVKGFANITEVIGKASAGSKEHIETLRTLGFTQKEIRSGTIDTEEVFNRFSAAVQRAESPAQALAFAGELMGDKVGRKLAGALRESGDEVDVLRDRFNELGLGLDQDAIDASERFNDTLDELKRQFGALGREVGQAVLPIIMDTLIPFLRDTGIPIMKQVAEAISKAVEWFGSLPKPVQEGVLVFTGLVAAIGPVLVVAGTLISSVGTIISAFSAVAPIVTAAGAAIAAIGLGPLTLIVGAIAAVVLAWKNWDTIGPIIANVYNAAKEWLLDKFTAIVDGIKGKIEAVTGFFGAMYDAVVGNSYVPDMIDGIGAHFKRLDAEMTAKADAETKKTAEAFQRLQESMVNAAEQGLGVFARRVEEVKDGLPGAIRNLREFHLVGDRLLPMLKGTLEQTTLLEIAQARWNERIRQSRDALQGQLAATIGLMPALKDMNARLAEAAEAAGTPSTGFLGKIKGLFGFFTDEAPGTLGGFSTLFGDVFRGLFGGGGGGGVLQSIIATGLTGLGNALFPGLGNLLASLAPIIAAGLEKLGKLFGDFFSAVGRGFAKIGEWLGIGGGPAAPPPPGYPTYPSDPGGGGHTDPGTGQDVPDVPSFATGTMGQYVNFGRGTLAMLHGYEKITPVGGEDGPRTTIIQIDGREIYKVVERHQNAALQSRRRMGAR